MSERKRNSIYIKKLTALAVFAALAYVVHFIHIPVSFLNLDFKDVIMTVAGMYFGPISGVVVAILVPLLEFPTSETGIYGLIMNLISSVTFVDRRNCRTCCGGNVYDGDHDGCKPFHNSVLYDCASRGSRKSYSDHASAIQCGKINTECIADTLRL